MWGRRSNLSNLFNGAHKLCFCSNMLLYILTYRFGVVCQEFKGENPGMVQTTVIILYGKGRGVLYCNSGNRCATSKFARICTKILHNGNVVYTVMHVHVFQCSTLGFQGRQHWSERIHFAFSLANQTDTSHLGSH